MKTFKLSNALQLFTVMLIWGTQFVASRFSTSYFPNQVILFTRYFLGASCLHILNGIRKRHPENIRNPFRAQKPDLKYFFFLGFGGYFISQSIQLIGTKIAGASIASVINATNPILITLFSCLILHEKITGRRIFCLGCEIVGVVIIAGSAVTMHQMLGIVLSLFAVLIWSAACVAMRSFTQSFDSLTTTEYALAIAGIFSLPGFLYHLAFHRDHIIITWQSAAALIYLGIVTTAFAHALWAYCLSQTEAGICALFYPIQPVVSIIFEAIVFGEAMNSKSFVGTALIIFGIFWAALEFFSIPKEVSE